MEDLALGFGFAVRAADFDDDGDPTSTWPTTPTPTTSIGTRAAATSRRSATWSGSAFDENGAAQASMGLAVGDVDGDGILDLFITNFSEDFSTLYQGLGGGFFEDVSQASGVGPATYRPLSWGTALADLDNDGDLDLVIANGHIYPQIDRHPELIGTYAQRNLLLENREHGPGAPAVPRRHRPRPARASSCSRLEPRPGRRRLRQRRRASTS